ncbi:MAG: tetratricopeptide (TPR) repeat protein [Planctomycetota bacterium]|jgi:tetratricopeptide (TPR) repeat protein
MKIPRRLLVAAAAMAMVGCAGRSSLDLVDLALMAPERTDVASPADFATPGSYIRPAPPLLDVSAEAKAWFDRGLLWMYSFNHDEAIRCFVTAQALAPGYAMAHWGEAHCHGPNINDAILDAPRTRLGYEAARRAVELKDTVGVAPIEAALIVAESRRFPAEFQADRTAQDEAYALEVATIAARHPDDADLAALAAEARLVVHPWDQWDADHRPLHDTEIIVSGLERALARFPEHPGLHHFYIHTMENSSVPERALPSAKILPSLAPGAGHMVHMPAHIYQRVGMYEAAFAANVAASAVDRRYFEVAPPQGLYHFYFIHNLHFEAWSAMYMGREEDAVRAAQSIEDETPVALLEELAGWLDAYLAVPMHVSVRFGRWEEVLAAPARDERFPIYNALRHYARGVALAATGHTMEAREEQVAYRAAASLVVDGMTVGINPAPPVMAVADAMLEGEIAYREERFDAAFLSLRRAVLLEDDLRYDEPSPWMQPVRHALGALLLEQGRAEEAEQVFVADLVRHPENGWALLGLQQALEAQQKAGPARKARKRFEQAWATATVEIAAPCFCATGAAPMSAASDD